ncbi:methyl-accepting chemotaxis protein [Bacillus sp. FJAT-49705]|uniref:Methyl-accepting chemotaxis protein n=1 Tax=Cytobacillus citreus TaxID=2833586 RepID=A0ABS5NXM8_9BACI|nr:methyl-accepting chemotaxis protein [Cytobacillus citreus]MBS4192575.1 methyl-accepting chemotaxis protein [Cytobacillus citreus]
MNLRTKLFLLIIGIIILFIGNSVYLIAEINNATITSKELEERDIKITLYVERLKLDTVQVQQWLTDISATRAAEGYDDGFTEAEKYAKDFRDTIAQLQSLDAANEDQYIVFLSSFNSFYEMGKEMAQAYINGGPTQGNKVMDKFDSYAEDINTKLDDVVSITEVTMTNKIASLVERTQTAKLISLISVIITTILSFVLAYFMITPIIKSINHLRVRSTEYAKGDLSQSININRKDEIGELAGTMTAMQRNLNHLIRSAATASKSVMGHSHKLRHSSNEIMEGSVQIASTMQELSSGAEAQARSASELAEKMSYFEGQIKKSSENGSEAVKSSNEVQLMTKNGSKEMDTSLQNMKKINVTMKNAVTKVIELDNQTKEISKLVQVIKDIAEQTNLLSINAAIEAARAGEHGKGFAVVADEVGKLSKQVSSSIFDITNIVEKIQLESTDVVQTLQSGYNDVECSTRQMETTGQSFFEIEQSMNNTVSQINDIGYYLSQINDNSYEMAQYIEKVASITEESAAGVEEVSASIQQSTTSVEGINISVNQLYELANELNKQITKFKISN